MIHAETIRERIMKKIQNRVAGDGYTILNATGPVAEIRIYSEIGFYGVSASQFVEDLDTITAPEIVVAINSLGGEVFDGIAIYNALRLKDAHITTRVDSMAASIASVVAQAGDHRQMVKSSQMMIHEAWGLVIGTARDMRELADNLDRQTDNIAAIYAERSGRELDEVRPLLTDETWFTDAEAVEEGFADEVISPPRREKTNLTTAPVVNVTPADPAIPADTDGNPPEGGDPVDNVGANERSDWLLRLDLEEAELAGKAYSE